MLFNMNRSELEIKSVIEEMFYCREDEIINLSDDSKAISADTNNTKNEEINKQFYTTGFKDGITTILESLT